MTRPKFSDLPLALKISLAPAFAMLMAGVVAVCTFYMQHEQVNALNNVVGAGALQGRFDNDSKRITAANGDLYSLMTRQAAGGSPAASAAALSAVLARIDAVKTDLTSLQASVPPAEQKNFARLLTDLTNYRGGVQVVGSMLGIDFNAAASFIAPSQTTYLQMTRTLDATSQAVAAAARQRADRTTAGGGALEKLLLVFLAFTFVLVTCVSGVITILVRQTVLAICGATEALASGKNEQDLSRLARRDEFGAIVRSLTVFKENQILVQTMGAEQVALQARQQELRREQEQTRQMAQEQQRLVVDTLAAALETLASGNLTQRITATFPAGYEKLKNDFNAALSKLAEAMLAVKTSITAMADGAGEILKVSSDVSGRTQSQAARLEQTAAAMDEITSTVKKTARGADEANNVVTAAKLDAEKSGAVARGTTSAMTSIEKSSKQIVSIIGLIDEIAFQTNLLALNAGIEAARAGDAGRGFAVVATEVRALAQRSANAAKEIKALIHASGTQIDSGVKLVAETGNALTRIVEQVNRLQELVTGIAGSAVDQASRLSEVNTVVSQIDQTTQQTAAMVEVTTAASRNLVQQAEALSQLIGQFSLGDRDLPTTGQSRRHEVPVLAGGQISAINFNHRRLEVAGTAQDEMV